MKKFILLFLIVLLSACSGKPTDTPETVCNQEMLDRFLRTELPFSDPEFDTEFFSEYVRLIFKATWESYGAEIGDQAWKIILEDGETETCLIVLQSYIKEESLNKGQIFLQPILSIQIEDEIVLPEDEPGRFFYRNYLGDDEYDGIPLSP